MTGDLSAKEVKEEVVPEKPVQEPKFITVPPRKMNVWPDEDPVSKKENVITTEVTEKEVARNTYNYITVPPRKAVDYSNIDFYKKQEEAIEVEIEKP